MDFEIYKRVVPSVTISVIARNPPKEFPLENVPMARLPVINRLKILISE